MNITIQLEEECRYGVITPNPEIPTTVEDGIYVHCVNGNLVAETKNIGKYPDCRGGGLV